MLRGPKCCDHLGRLAIRLARNGSGNGGSGMSAAASEGVTARSPFSGFSSGGHWRQETLRSAVGRQGFAKCKAGAGLRASDQSFSRLLPSNRLYSNAAKGWMNRILDRSKEVLSTRMEKSNLRIPRLPKLVPLSEVKKSSIRLAADNLNAFWQKNRHVIIGFGVSIAIYYTWRTTYGIASMFIDLTETFAEAGFLAMAVALTGAAYLYLQERARINPNKLFRMAMTRLNTSPSVLSVMGAPLSGSHLQASVLSGGGLRVKKWNHLKMRSRRLHMIFPVVGPEARGVVSIEAKKKGGKHQFKLLAIDVVTNSGREERIFLDGNDAYYNRGGVLSELRDPFLKVAAAQTMYEIEDDEEDAVPALGKPSGILNATQGSQVAAEERQIYFYEWSWEYLMDHLNRMSKRVAKTKSASS